MKIKTLFIITDVLLILTLYLQFCRGCELLVLNRTDTDESKGMYARYDPISIKPDGWNWGKMEKNKNIFLIVKLPLITEEQAWAWTQEGKTKRRDRTLAIASIPQAQRDELTSNGVVTLNVSFATMNSFIVTK